MKKTYFILIISLGILLCPAGALPVAADSNDPDSIKLYEEKEGLVQVLSYKEKRIPITEEDMHLMAQIVYAESRSEPFDGKVAVASVIINRLTHPDFPKTIEGVIKQKNAFSCVVNGKINVVPTPECYKAVQEALKGNDPTKNAVFFYNPKIATSQWMKNVGKNNVTPIGNHVFFVVKK